MKKLFEVNILNDMDWIVELYVGDSKEEIEKRVWDENKENSLYSCLTHVTATEITSVDGWVRNCFKVDAYV